MKSIRQLLQDHDVIIYEPVTLRSGEVSPYYADIKKSYGNPKVLHELALAIAGKLDKKTTCLAASGYGGLPLGTAVSQISGLPFVMVRDTEKNHGMRGLIDGYVPTVEDAVSVLDDVFTSGSSLTQTITTLEMTGANIIGCHVVLARGDIEKFNYAVSYLLNAQELL